MSSDRILEVEGVSKLYARTQKQARARLRSTLGSAFLGREPKTGALLPGEIWAVNDVSFSVDRGRALGIIGLNGSGKTTLLRMIAGQLLPDRGEIRLYGRSASVIALQAGMQKQLSGRKNIFLRSAMLGRSKEETKAVIDRIIDFTELGEAIDAPIATYSSGMTVRLAFAITIFTDPDLLIVDETLSVGDFKFRQKCLEKVRELRERTSFVLVSHSMNDIMRFCDEAILLRKGEVAFQGEPEEAIDLYLEKSAKARGRKNDEAPVAPASAAPAVAMGQFTHNKSAIANVSHHWIDEKGAPSVEFWQGEAMRLRVAFDLSHKPRKLIIGVPVWTDDGHFLTAFSTEFGALEGYEPHDGRHEFELQIANLPFMAGKYHAVVAITDGPEIVYRAPAAGLEISDALPYGWGSVKLDYRWRERAPAEENLALERPSTN